MENSVYIYFTNTTKAFQPQHYSTSQLHLYQELFKEDLSRLFHEFLFLDTAGDRHMKSINFSQF